LEEPAAYVPYLLERTKREYIERTYQLTGKSLSLALSLYLFVAVL
jgi:hypothetical protein